MTREKGKKKGIWINYLIRAHFQQNINVFFIFENTFKLDDIFMMKGFMDFDFCQELKGRVS